jgi:hypothetical protein
MYLRAIFCAVTALLALGQNRAGADFLLTFEGLQNFEQVTNYYGGGKGSLGSGPGTNFGITFTANALAYIPGKQSGMVTPFPGDPSPPTVLLLANPNPPLSNPGSPATMTMDVSGGFTQYLDYYYINIAATNATIQIFSGLDGTGQLLAQTQLAPQPNPTNPVFSGESQLAFNGTAHSVVFSGNDNQLAFDDIAGSTGPPTTPEPASWLLMLGCAGACWFVMRQRRQPVGCCQEE